MEPRSIWELKIDQLNFTRKITIRHAELGRLLNEPLWVDWIGKACSVHKYITVCSGPCWQTQANSVSQTAILFSLIPIQLFAFGQVLRYYWLCAGKGAGPFPPCFQQILKACHVPSIVLSISEQNGQNPCPVQRSCFRRGKTGYVSVI